MGAIDHDKVTEILKAMPKKRTYTQFSDRDRLLVRKHAAIFGNARAVRKVHVSESTVTLFCRKYKSFLTNMYLFQEVPKIPKAYVVRPLRIGKSLDK